MFGSWGRSWGVTAGWIAEMRVGDDVALASGLGDWLRLAGSVVALLVEDRR